MLVTGTSGLVVPVLLHTLCDENSVELAADSISLPCCMADMRGHGAAMGMDFVEAYK
jgi:hypothetical protein